MTNGQRAKIFAPYAALKGFGDFIAASERRREERILPGEDAQEEEAARWGHSTFRQAALLAKEAGVKCLWLTHFSQAMVSPEDSLMNARHVFENAVCGYDGLSIHLKYADS